MQKLIITGNVGNDADLRTTKNGNNVCSFSVATSMVIRGEKQTTWFRVSAFSKLAEICSKYVHRGMKVCVVGSVSVSSYESKEGGTRFTLEVRAEDVEFLSPKEQSDAAEPAKKPVPDGFQEVDDTEDLPF